MKKKYISIAIALWTLVAVAIVGIFIFSINGGFSDMNVKVKDETISLNNIQDIIIKSSYQKIEVIKTNSNSITITQYSNTKRKNANSFMVSNDNNCINVYFKNTLQNNLFTNIFNLNVNERLVIELPENYKGNLELQTSSGSIKVNDEFSLNDVLIKSSSGSTSINQKLTAYSLNMNTSSGSIKLEDITIEDAVTAKSSSGNIKFNGKVTAEAVSVKSSSGSIKFNNIVTAGIINAESTSGGIKFNDMINASVISTESSSGGIKLNGTVTAEEINVKTTSGSISLGIIKVKGYSLKSTSGKISCDSISGGGDVKTSSGGIKLSLENPSGNVILNSTSGSIKITLESSLAFTLDAETSSGSIRTNFTVDKNSKGNKVSAVIGSNPVVKITASASSGGIKVEN